MCKEYLTIENEPWETAFLSGAVDVLAERLDDILDYPNDIAADVFYVKDNDMSLLNDTVKKRLRYYCRQTDDDDLKNAIETLDLRLREVKTDVHSFICEKLGRSHYCSSDKLDKLSEEVKVFLDHMRRYLKEPLCIYEQADRLANGFIDETSETLGYVYLYVGFEYFFISYKDHLVFILLGTVE